METTAVSRAALPEAGGATSGQAEATTPEIAAPAETAMAVTTAEAAATTGIQEAAVLMRILAEMTAQMVTVTGAKKAEVPTAVQVRTGGAGCSGRDVSVEALWKNEPNLTNMT